MNQPLSIDINELFSIIGELEATRRKQERTH
jgi:hypothetical protein